MAATACKCLFFACECCFAETKAIVKRILIGSAPEHHRRRIVGEGAGVIEASVGSAEIFAASLIFS